MSKRILAYHANSESYVECSTEQEFEELLKKEPLDDVTGNEKHEKEFIVSKQRSLLLSKTRVSADAECLRDVKAPYSFGASQFLGNACTCTLSNGKIYKDWILDSSIFAFWKYIVGHELVITFNGLNFDYPLWGGSVLGPEHIEARSFFEKTLKGRTVDLLKDFEEALGVKVGLEAVAVPTLGTEFKKEMSGGFAPEQWRNGNCLEVLEYCRGDIRRTDNLFVKAANGEKLKVQLRDGQIREFTCLPKIR